MSEIQQLLQGHIHALCVEIDGRLNSFAAKPPALLAGSFNPVHQGHWLLAASAARLTGAPVAFELSVVNVDKPPLSQEEIRQRLNQFIWRTPLWLTRAPTFVEKSQLFPGAFFVVGADTAERILSSRYYQGCEDQLALALDQIRRLKCRFLVGGRENPDRHFLQLADLRIPDGYANLFHEIPDFRHCSSSTALRRDRA